jgi:hypothetical protein
VRKNWYFKLDYKRSERCRNSSLVAGLQARSGLRRSYKDRVVGPFEISTALSYLIESSEYDDESWRLPKRYGTIAAWIIEDSIHAYVNGGKKPTRRLGVNGIYGLSVSLWISCGIVSTAPPTISWTHMERAC